MKEMLDHTADVELELGPFTHGEHFDEEISEARGDAADVMRRGAGIAVEG